MPIPPSPVRTLSTKRALGLETVHEDASASSLVLAAAATAVQPEGTTDAPVVFTESPLSAARIR